MKKNLHQSLLLSCQVNFRNSFKESFLVFQNRVERRGPDISDADEPAKTKELKAKTAVETRNKGKEAATETAVVERHDAAHEIADQLTKVMSDDFKDLDQTKFNSILGKIAKNDDYKFRVQTDHITQLVNFAGNSKNKANFDKIVEAVKSNQLNVRNFNTFTINKVLEFYKNDTEKTKTLIGQFCSTVESTATLLRASQENKEIIEACFKVMNTYQAVFKSLDWQSLNIFALHIDSKNIVKSMSPSQKIEVLANPWINALGTIILENSSKEEKIAIIKDLKNPYKARLIVWNKGKLTEAEKKDLPEPKEEEKAPEATDDKPAKGPKPSKTKGDRIIEDSEEMSMEKLLKEAGINTTKNTVRWMFDIPDGGKTLKSIRSFGKTKAFQKAFKEKAEDGELNTPDKIKLFTYQWLFDKTYGGKLNTKKNPYKVKNFPQSQTFLKAEIDRLEKATAEPQKEDGDGNEIPKTEKPASTSTKYFTKVGEPIKHGWNEDEVARTDTDDKGIIVKTFKDGSTLTIDSKDKNKVVGFTEAPTKILEKPEEKLSALSKEGLTLKTTPEDAKTLTEGQYQALKENKKAMDEAFKSAPDIFAIIATLQEVDNAFDANFGNSKDPKLSIQFKPEKSNSLITWQPDSVTGFNFADQNALINKILEIKRDQLGEDSEEYKKFFELSRTKQGDVDKEQRADDKASKYIENYDKLTSQAYMLDGRIGSLYEGDIEKYWERMDGHKSVENIMSKPPFDILPHQVSTVTAKIISDGYNDRVYFSDILNYRDPKGKPFFSSIDKSKIPAEALSSSKNFLAEFNRLMNTPPDKMTTAKEEQMASMYTQVMVPALNLLEAMQHLRYPEEGIQDKTELTPDQQVDAGLAPGQEKTTEGLKKLFNFSESPANGWDKMMNFFAGGESTMTMGRADGTTFVVDKGMFERHYNPHSAMLALLNTPGLYKLDAQGKKTMQPDVLLAEVNKIINTGKAQLQLQKIFNNRYTSDDVKTINSLEDLNNISDKQMAVFQLGFIQQKLAQSEGKIKEAADVLKDAPPAVKAILEELKKGGVPANELNDIKSTLLAMAYIHFNKSGDKYEATGFGIGTKIPLGDGKYSLLIGAGANFQGNPPVLAGIGLNINVYKGETSQIDYHTTISMMGASTGISGNHDLGGGVELGWDFGIGFSWANVMAVGALGNLSLSWEKANINQQKDKYDKLAQDESGLLDLWNKWSELDQSARWELLTKHPQYKQIQEAMSKNPEMTQNFVLNGINLYIESLKATDVYGKMHAIPFMPMKFNFGALAATALIGGPVGLALGVVGGFGFQIGSVTVFMAHPREEARILSQISDIVTTNKVKQRLEDMKNGKTEGISFTEKTPDVYFRPGSKLGLGTRVGERKEINLSSFKNDLAASNEALKPAEIRLVKNGDRVELIVDNDDDKDVEIHIDPKAFGLAIVKDPSSGKTFLSGNTDDLIITRERFEFPYAKTEAGASLRDVITIRQAASVTGNRDRTWIEQHESAYLERILGTKDFVKRTGADDMSGQNNIRIDDAQGYYKQFEGAAGNKIDQARLDQWDKDGKEMGTALGETLTKDHNKERNVKDEELYPQLDKMCKDPKFKKELIKTENLDNPDNMIDLIVNYRKEKNLKELTPKELDIANSYLLNTWFTNLYKGPLERELSNSQMRAINQRLIARLKSVSNYTGGKYLKEFEKVKEKLGDKIKSSPEDMKKQLMDDIYGPLLKLLQKNPPVDFRKAVNVENGLLPGDVLVSGSRGKEKGHTRATFGRTLNYEEVDKPEKLLNEYGFLSSADIKIGQQYDLKDANQVKRDLARTLLEIASPIEKSDLKLIKSPLALKILGLKAYRLIVEENEGGAEQYKAMTEIVKDPSKISEYPEAMKNFRKFVERVRTSQIEGNPLIIKTKQGLTITLDFSATKIESGAYSKCGNPSYKINESGVVSIKRPGGVVGTMDRTNEVVDTELSKRFVSLSILGGFTSTEAPKQEKSVQGQPENKGSVGTDYGKPGVAPTDQGLGGGAAGAASHTSSPAKYE